MFSPSFQPLKMRFLARILDNPQQRLSMCPDEVMTAGPLRQHLSSISGHGFLLRSSSGAVMMAGILVARLAARRILSLQYNSIARN
jgi:hypothetical protein